jgi:hypothetical protein
MEQPMGQRVTQSDSLMERFVLKEIGVLVSGWVR